MVKSFHEGFYEEVPALAAAAKRKSASPAAMPSQVNKSARIPQSRLHSKREPARLVKPDDLPEKRQRTDDGPIANSVSVEEIIQEIKPILPRVGKTIITQESILGALQKLFDDKIIIKVVACKRTERAIPPPKNLQAEEAPYRRAIVEAGNTKEVMIEDQWVGRVDTFVTETTCTPTDGESCKYNSLCSQSNRK